MTTMLISLDSSLEFDKDVLSLWARPSEELDAIEVFIAFIHWWHRPYGLLKSFLSSLIDWNVLMFKTTFGLGKQISRGKSLWSYHYSQILPMSVIQTRGMINTNYHTAYSRFKKWKTYNLENFDIAYAKLCHCVISKFSYCIILNFWHSLFLFL